LRDIRTYGGAVARDECRFHLALFLKEEGQPLDILALHVPLKLNLDLGATQKTDFLASQVLGRSDSHRLVHKEALIVIEDGRAKAQARVGCIDEIRRTRGK